MIWGLITEHGTIHSNFSIWFILALQNMMVIAASNKRAGNRYDTDKKRKNLFDAGGMLEIESLSISLYVKPLACSKVSPVQLTGTRTAKASKVMGTNIFKLHICFVKCIILPEREM